MAPEVNSARRAGIGLAWRFLPRTGISLHEIAEIESADWISLSLDPFLKYGGPLRIGLDHLVQKRPVVFESDALAIGSVRFRDEVLFASAVGFLSQYQAQAQIHWLAVGCGFSRSPEGFAALSLPLPRSETSRRILEINCGDLLQLTSGVPILFRLGPLSFTNEDGRPHFGTTEIESLQLLMDAFRKPFTWSLDLGRHVAFRGDETAGMEILAFWSRLPDDLRSGLAGINLTAPDAVSLEQWNLQLQILKSLGPSIGSVHCLVEWTGHRSARSRIEASLAQLQEALPHATA